MKTQFLYSILFLIPFLLFSCEKEEVSSGANHESHHDDDHICDENCDENTKPLSDHVFEMDGETWLWGGDNDDWHFMVSNIGLDLSNLKFGLGRETFMALISPQYQKVSTINDSFFKGDDEFILVEGPSEKKSYPIDLMIKHEVINDIIDGEPVMVSYCVLADFAGVFSRNYCGETFTFAVSGYTYSEEAVWEGKDGFVLWDRDTESLWWPLINQAVSGGMKNKKLNSNIGNLNWSIINWEELKGMDDIDVLRYNQTMEPPLDYPEKNAEEICN